MNNVFSNETGRDVVDHAAAQETKKKLDETYFTGLLNSITESFKLLGSDETREKFLKLSESERTEVLAFLRTISSFATMFKVKVVDDSEFDFPKTVDSVYMVLARVLGISSGANFGGEQTDDVN